MRRTALAALFCVQAAAARAASAAAALEWKDIPAGSFIMGAPLPGEGPEHPVRIAAFQLARSPVTNAQYRACVEAGACSPAHAADGKCHIYATSVWDRGPLPKAYLGDDQPVVCVTWDQARAFSEWAGGRLPSEAEWEYAARGGGRYRYPWGDEKPSSSRAKCSRRVGAQRVCARPKGDSPHGVCDLAGNVWEWTADWYHRSYDGAPADGSAWLEPATSHRVRRGGCLETMDDRLRATHRFNFGPEYADIGTGFRPARRAPEAAR